MTLGEHLRVHKCVCMLEGFFVMMLVSWWFKSSKGDAVSQFLTAPEWWKNLQVVGFLLPWTKWGRCLGCSSEEWVLGGDVVNASRPIRTVWDLAAVGYDAATTSAHCRREIEHTVVGKPLGRVTLVSHRLKKLEIEMRLSHTVCT